MNIKQLRKYANRINNYDNKKKARQWIAELNSKDVSYKYEKHLIECAIDLWLAGERQYPGGRREVSEIKNSIVIPREDDIRDEHEEALHASNIP